jgi:hypothetical protein
VLILCQLLIYPLCSSNVLPQGQLEAFINEVFFNVLDLRDCNRRMLEQLRIRKREQTPVVQHIGDIFLGAAMEFRAAYERYAENLPLAENRVNIEMETNARLRSFFLEVTCSSTR